MMVMRSLHIYESIIQHSKFYQYFIKTLKKIMNGSFSNHLKGGTIKTKTNKLCFDFFL